MGATFYIVLIVVVVLLIKNYYNKLKKNLNEPNGPIPLPIIGNMHQLSMGPRHLVMEKLDRQYNGVVRIWAGDRYFVFISDIKLLQEMLVDRYTEFSDRPLIPSWRLLSNNGVGIVSSSGELWNKNKFIVHKAIRKANSNKLTSLIEQKVQQLLMEMTKYEKSGELFYPNYYFKKFALSTMYKYVFGEDISYDKDMDKNGVLDLGQQIDKLFEILFNNSILDYFDIFDSFYYWYLKRTDTSFSSMRNLINEKLDQHLKSIDPENPRDLLDLLIIEFGLNSTVEDISLNVNQVCFDMFSAGVATSADTIEWILLHMVNNPEIQDKVFNELKYVVRNKDSITLSDRMKTPYLQAVIKEQFRLGALFGLPRIINENKMLGNYFLPKDSIIFTHARAISRNEKYYSNPNIFDPNRFLNNANSVFSPFGLGPRNCPGQVMGNDQIYLLLSNLLLKFKIKSIDGKKLNDEGKFGLSVVPMYKFGVLLESR